MNQHSADAFKSRIRIQQLIFYNTGPRRRERVEGGGGEGDRI